MFSNITLPTLEEISDKNNAEKIRGYLATLHDQLRYMMLNIDTDNLSDGLKTTISDASENAEFSKNNVIELNKDVTELNGNVTNLNDGVTQLNGDVTKINGNVSNLNDGVTQLNGDVSNLNDGVTHLNGEVSQLNGEVYEIKQSLVSYGDRMSSVTQTADKINWLIKDGTSSSDFTLTSRTASLISDCIDFTGYVKFNDLSQSGSTSINGNNIMTGTLSADKISVTDLSALSASIGGWSLNSTGLSTTASGYGSLSLNSASSSDSYWLKATNANGYTTFYISKNGSCYFNGSYISNGSITASKISTDGENRLDLTNNYNGIKVGSTVHITNGSVTRRMFVNPAGILSFDTGGGNTAFSLGLTRDGSNYTLSVLNGSGQIVGNINL